MGHEFLEMKNTPAAIEAYRKAVGIQCSKFADKSDQPT